MGFIEFRNVRKIYHQGEVEICALNGCDFSIEKGRIVIFGCGTGNPFFSTDTAAALRAAEIEADILMKATMVDGVYDKDPNKFDDAKKYETMNFTEVVNNQLGVMDSTAAALCRDNGTTMLVFDLRRPDNIYDACVGEKIGTLILPE